MQSARGKGLIVRQWAQLAPTPDGAVRRLRRAGFTWVSPMVMWGHTLNSRITATRLRPYFIALRRAGIDIWPMWGLPVPETWRSALPRFIAFAVDVGAKGVALDAEREWKGQDEEAGQFASVARVHCNTRNLSLALCSYSLTTAHRDFPWAAFAAMVDLGIAQTYDREMMFDPSYPARCVESWTAQGFREVYPMAGLWNHRDGRPKSAAEVIRHLALIPPSAGVLIWAPVILTEVWSVLTRWRRASSGGGAGVVLAVAAVAFGVALAAGRVMG